MPSPTNSDKTGTSRLGTALNALLWAGVIVLALFPFPWWW